MCLVWEEASAEASEPGANGSLSGLSSLFEQSARFCRLHLATHLSAAQPL